MKQIATFVGLVVAYISAWMAGSQLLVPAVLRDRMSAEEQASSAIGLVIVAIVDVAVAWAIARASRLRGWRLFAMLALVLYGVKTFTGILEAAYFMRNVTPDLLPGLFAMTLPACLVLAAFTTITAGGVAEEPAWRGPDLSRGEWWVRIAVLSALVYPVLFFTAGWFIAFRSDAVRAFYGAPLGGTFLSSMAATFRAEPLLYPFEVLRGALWVAMALPILRTARGSAMRATLLVVLLFALVQNDVHLLPNPLMPPEVRLHHFIETSTSNAIWAFCIGWLMTQPRFVGVVDGAQSGLRARTSQIAPASETAPPRV